jgi:opacity protein-like surface antigen
MKSLLSAALLVSSFLSAAAVAQTAAFPPSALGAKTIAVLNDTHTGTVEEGAEDALKQWGHFKLIDDPDAADVVLHFSKKSEHSTSSAQKTDANGNPTDYGFTISSDTTIEMTATTKDGFSSFYSTTTKEGK